MNKYDVTLTAHYEKTVSVYADTPEQAKEKIETVLFDTDIIQFTDEDFIGGDATLHLVRMQILRFLILSIKKKLKKRILSLKE